MFQNMKTFFCVSPQQCDCLQSWWYWRIALKVLGQVVAYKLRAPIWNWPIQRLINHRNHINNVWLIFFSENVIVLSVFYLEIALTINLTASKTKNCRIWTGQNRPRALQSGFVVFSTSAISILSSFLKSSQNSTQKLWFSCSYVENCKNASRSPEWGGQLRSCPPHFRNNVFQYFKRRVPHCITGFNTLFSKPDFVTRGDIDWAAKTLR